MAGRDDAPPDWHAAPLGDDGSNPATRTPPSSPEAEQSVLGGLLVDNSALERISDLLGESDFFSINHQAIFSAVRSLIDEGKLADVITVFERLQSLGVEKQVGGLAYINDLAQGVPSATGIRRYAEIVRERAIRRKIIAAGDKIAANAFNPQGRDLDHLLTGVEEDVAQLLRERSRKLPGSRIPLLSLDQLRQSSESVRWLVKHVIPAEAVGMLFGGSGSFKSFIALDLALHVGHGLPWMGRRVKAKGPVLYIAAEGGAGLWPRIDAWHRARRLRWGDAGMHVVKQAVNLGVDAWRIVDAAQAAGVTPALVVVDTLSQTYSGEENSASEMAAYLRELGARFRAMWGCSVLVIHHSGHQASERPRGSSAILANVDFMLGAFRDDKEMLATITCVKQKDGDRFADAMFSLKPMRLGTDEDGDDVTSLVAWHLSSAEEIQEAMKAESKAGRGGRNQLLLGLVQNGMRELDLKKAFFDEVGIENEEARRQAYHRARLWATSKGYFEVSKGTVITLKPGVGA